MLDESICHFKGILSISSLFLFLIENNVDRDQTPHDVASDLGPHCLSMIISWVSR